MADNTLKRNVTWSQNAYNAAVMATVALPWSNDTTPFPCVPDAQHGLLDVIGPLHQKYVPNSAHTET